MNSCLVFAVVVGVLVTGCAAGTIPLVSSPFVAAPAPLVAASSPLVAASAPVVAAGAPVAFTSAVGYTHAVPYNVPPYASRIDLSSKTLAARYIAAPFATYI